MAFEIQAEDDFNLLQLQDTITAEDIHAITHQLSEGLLDSPYVIVEPYLNEPMDKEIWLMWKELDDLVHQNKGVLIFVAGGKEFEETVNDADLTYIPSFDEAVDYIFIDRLEKEFDEDEQN